MTASLQRENLSCQPTTLEHNQQPTKILHLYITQREKAVCNKPDVLQKEMEHHRKALSHCKYPKWAFDRVEEKAYQATSEVNNRAEGQGPTAAQPTANEVKTKDHIVITYTQGLVESIKKIYSRYGMHTHFKVLQVCNSAKLVSTGM